jgi:hypothetical protein
MAGSFTGVEGELVEPVAEVLRRFMPGGVVIESTQSSRALMMPKEKASGPLRVYGYLTCG